MLFTIPLLLALAALDASLAAPLLGTLYAASAVSSTTTLLVAVLFIGTPAFANYVPNYICSWKPTPGSPELGGYEWFCNAKKRITGPKSAEWHCDDHHEWIADLGALDLNPGILRFSELLVT